MTRASCQLDERTVNEARSTSKAIDIIVETMIAGAVTTLVGGLYNNENVVNAGLVVAGIAGTAMAIEGAYIAGRAAYRIIRSTGE